MGWMSPGTVGAPGSWRTWAAVRATGWVVNDVMSTAPTAAQVTGALTRLPGAPDQARAALHVALPVTAAVGPDAWAADGRVHFRGFSEPLAEDAPSSVARLARRAQRPADTFVDLTAEPHTWVKVLPSGARRVVFGTDVLFGTPLASLEDGVEEGAALEWAQLCSGSSVPDLPLVLPSGVMVDGNRGRAVLRGAAGRAPWPAMGTVVNTLEERARLIAGRVKVDFDGLSVTCRRDRVVFPGTERFSCQVVLDDAWVAEVPLTVSAGSELVGARPGDALVCDVTGPGLPEQFSVLGPRAADGALVVRHDPTGIVAVARNVSGRG